MNWKKGVYSFFVTMFVLPMVMAADQTLTLTQVYGYLRPYIMPEGMTGVPGAVIGIVTILIIFVIFIDLLEIATPFSKWANWMISIGLAIIAVVTKVNVTVAAWVFKSSALIFAWAGALAVFLNVIFSVLVLIAIFFGAQWVSKWAANMRRRRDAVRAGTATETAKSGLRTLHGIGKEAADLD